MSKCLSILLAPDNIDVEGFQLLLYKIRRAKQKGNTTEHTSLTTEARQMIADAKAAS